MSEKFCYFHKDRLAHRIMPSGRGLCDECFKINQAKFPMASAPAFVKPDVPPARPAPPAPPLVKEEPKVPAGYAVVPRVERPSPVTERTEIVKMLMDGESVHNIFIKTAIKKQTIKNIRSDIWNQLPHKCKCGRGYGHRGPCFGAQRIVMKKSEPSHDSGKVTSQSDRRMNDGKFLAEIRDMLEGLRKQRVELDGKIEACETVLKLSAQLWPSGARQ
jgi:hypothetical protein